MTTKHKVEVKPWQPKMEREPEFNPFVNPLDRELENPRPLEESESEDSESAQNTGGPADAERGRRLRSAEVYDRSVDVQLCRLRSKIETNPSTPEFIRTERGLGYRFCASVTTVHS